MGGFPLKVKSESLILALATDHYEYQQVVSRKKFLIGTGYWGGERGLHTLIQAKEVSEDKRLFSTDAKAAGDLKPAQV